MIGFLLVVLLLAALIGAVGVALVQPWRNSESARIEQIEVNVQAADQRIEAMTRQSLQQMRHAAREQQRAQRPTRDR